MSVDDSDLGGLEMLTLEQIKKDTIWVVKMNWGRLSGTYDKMLPYIEEDDEYSYCRDYDVCCEQPEHLKEFYDGLFKYEEEHGYTLIDDYYNNVYSKRKVWTKEEVKELLNSNNKAVMRGILAIYNRQTESEQYCDDTHEVNGVGFNGIDAPFLSNLAKWILDKGYLTDKQMVIARKKMLKYSQQLADIANI